MVERVPDKNEVEGPIPSTPTLAYENRLSDGVKRGDHKNEYNF